MEIREITTDSFALVWPIIEPVIRAGTTYALDRAMSEDETRSYWFRGGNRVFVAVDEVGDVLGTYYLRPNQAGGGAHVANAGYMVSANAQGKGVARAMCSHSLAVAKEKYRAMQFNFVVSTNERAVKLWQSFGFEILTRIPEAFAHPDLGFVDALLMYKKLDS
ncbi:MAG: GNAT family N-acetyltransferase [Alphaproteobacteria bacterium]